ncbi:IS1096 element passenger TnpR family protein [Sporolactobacillus terrae]|uniref:Plasmid pRiA4b Orf3-like domain-containing protein n=1 Tax=Sporolactobacillus terrae TaxID=269673 RepID=A0A410D778_9BACL|nr:hypothetical protein [Sporolactobacillus terrae]QAA21953.1 hypothetical protein C0674_04595 [Sporolactobacillus terrae]QAA24926.1 hypothetical protein C0679_04570 [Sporolactobacillus terrae]BBN98230.1 hypothetical protein St703_09350 [Sporolactobacillus terrae]
MIYQLKIVLKEYDQLLWIRLQLDETVTFATLYDAICYAFDLSAQGTHHFVLSPADALDRSLLQCEQQCRLPDCFSNSRGLMGRLFYQDTLQTMKFNLFVEQIIPPQKGIKYPMCTTVSKHLGSYIAHHKPWVYDPYEKDLVQVYEPIRSRSELTASINAHLHEDGLNPFLDL